MVRQHLTIDDRTDLFADIPDGDEGLTVWMSHGDHLTTMPPGFEAIGHTANAPICAIRNPAKRIYAVQFHPEVVHTPRGKDVLRNFLYRICGCTGGWSATSFIQRAIEDIRQKVGRRKGHLRAVGRRGFFGGCCSVA